MSACEKCWRDASLRAALVGGSVSDHYHDVLRERQDHPCSEAEQRGPEAQEVDRLTCELAESTEAIRVLTQQRNEMAARASTAPIEHIWCDGCGTIRPLVRCYMSADGNNGHAATDLLCGECRIIIATLHYLDDTQPSALLAVERCDRAAGMRPVAEDESQVSWACGCYEDRGGYHSCASARTVVAGGWGPPDLRLAKGVCNTKPDQVADAPTPEAVRARLLACLTRYEEQTKYNALFADVVAVMRDAAALLRPTPRCEACRGTEVVPVWDSARRDDWHQQTCPICQGGDIPAALPPPAGEREAIARFIEACREERDTVQTFDVLASLIRKGKHLEVAPPAGETPGCTLTADAERSVREYLWLSHGHRGMYGDDGEMQCSECARYGVDDYQRAPLVDVIRVARAARQAVNTALLTAAQADDREE